MVLLKNLYCKVLWIQFFSKSKIFSFEFKQNVSIYNSFFVFVRSGDNPNLLSPEILNQRRGSRRPSILPVPDMFTSSTLNIATEPQDEGDESEDELEDDVPWRSPSEKIA